MNRGFGGDAKLPPAFPREMAGRPKSRAEFRELLLEIIPTLDFMKLNPFRISPKADECIRCVMPFLPLGIEVSNLNWLFLEGDNLRIEFKQKVEVAFERRLESDGASVLGTGQDSAETAGFLGNLPNGHTMRRSRLFW